MSDVSMHIESAAAAVRSLDYHHTALTEGYGYESESTGNQVDSLLEHSYKHATKAESHDSRGDYSQAHASLVALKGTAMTAAKLMEQHAGKDLSLEKMSMDNALVSYKHENFS